MPAIFVHLSDIHFGQERDDTVHIHEDVKKQLIDDAAEVVSRLPGGIAHGILVTGDITHSGKRPEYEAAARWLDELAGRVGCPINRVQMVPGNHDVDRDRLSTGGSLLLDHIRGGGAAEYENVIGNPADRASLLARFEEYGRFSCGYDCALDLEVRYATNLQIELAPGRSIRFIRINSSLLCHGKERHDSPELVIGARQFIIPRNRGEENVVLVHHPLHWYKDSDDVRRYVRSRARVFISGHEHDPKVAIDAVGAGCDLMMLAAGAAVPFKSNEIYTHTYNVIEFDWDEDADALAVTMHPRAWKPGETRFDADERRLGGKQPRFVLGSPSFKSCERPAVAARPAVGLSSGDSQPGTESNVVDTKPNDEAPRPPSAEGYGLALLRFFRDLLENERLKLLVELDAIPADSDERMTQAVERKLFDWLVREGKLPKLSRRIEELIDEREDRHR